jgi:hypothetical protein
MASVNDVYRKFRTASPTTCAPPELKCSTCGMLECVCRPRFFAGQVLHADDLNRLDAYIRAKHRLHNRQLHGWGVVNGLEVICNPCGDGLAVGCGYALSPCGEDIVVCDAVTVDICNLILRCKDSEAKRGPCEPFQHPLAAGCDAAEEEWVLAIRYSEKPARGVKPLYAPAERDCGCSCGKASCTCNGAKGGCACGATSSSNCTCGTGAKPRAAPVQCEATVICEGFAFELYRKPPAPNKDPDSRGSTIAPDSELVRRFVCCYDDLVKNAPQMPAAFSPAAIAADPNAWYLWACHYKAHLLHHFSVKPGYNCDLLARLSALVIVPPQNAAGLAAFMQALHLMFLVLLDALLACLCSALLPPCPAPTQETRVPLALLHVATHPCRVLRVCNWSTERKFATTFPALQYWLSILPFGVALREMLQAVCCFDVTSLFRERDAGQDVVTPLVPPRAPGAGINVAPGVSSGTASVNNDLFHEQAFRRLNPMFSKAGGIQDSATLVVQTLFSGQPLEPERLINTLLASGVQGDKLGSLARSNLPQFMLLNQLVKPVAEAAAGPLGASALGARAGAGAAGASDLAAMREELASLRARVDKQAAEIERLKPPQKRPRGGGNR